MKSKKVGNKGDDFEERLRAYFDQAGFFAVKGIPFLFDGEDVSDIDVWLYERPNATSRRRTIVDAKNKQRPKAVERILWLKGFQQGLGVESAIVATTDRRSSVRRFASTLGIGVLDGEAVDRLVNTQRLESADRISGNLFYNMLQAADGEQGEKEWRSRFDSGKASLAANLGFLSANQNLENARFFLAKALLRSGSAKEVATRAFLVCSAYSALSLDYAAKDWSFRSFDERCAGFTLGLRFGESGISSTLEVLKLSIGLVRQYADNGSAIAKQIESRFNEDASRIPVEIIAEYVAKISSKDTLFRVAKELEFLGHTSNIVKFDDFSIDVKSYLGVLLDFMEVPRRRLDDIFPLEIPSSIANASKNAKRNATEEGMLPLKQPE